VHFPDSTLADFEVFSRIGLSEVIYEGRAGVGPVDEMHGLALSATIRHDLHAVSEQLVHVATRVVEAPRPMHGSRELKLAHDLADHVLTHPAPAKGLALSAQASAETCPPVIGLEASCPGESPCAPAAAKFEDRSPSRQSATRPGRNAQNGRQPPPDDEFRRIQEDERAITRSSVSKGIRGPGRKHSRVVHAW